MIRGVIGTDGVPRDLVVVQSVPGLDQAALEAVSQWRFTPARNASGQAIDLPMTMTVNFVPR